MVRTHGPLKYLGLSGVQAIGCQLAESLVQQVALRVSPQDKHLVVMIRRGVVPLIALSQNQQLVRVQDQGHRMSWITRHDPDICMEN